MLRHRLGNLPLKFLPEEYQILRELKKVSVRARPVVVAVSGGLDSIVLLNVLNRLQRVLKFRLSVAHIHHGASTNTQLRYRNQTQKFVQKIATELKLPFYTNVPALRGQKVLKSEEELRSFRYQELVRIMGLVTEEEGEPSVLALAHHRDDLLETQLLRLIRGTGVDGLRAMGTYSDDQNKLRPLLVLSRAEILYIAKKLKLKWREDPSNMSLEPLRNWLRRSWLPALERRVPGVRSSLSRSLNHIAKISFEIRVDKNTKSYKKGEIDRQQYLALGPRDRLSLIVRYLRTRGVRKYTQGQIEEICRRLDNRRGEYTFTLLGFVWDVNTQRIKAKKF